MIPSNALLVVYALAVYRLTRLVTTDTITDGVREWLRVRAYGRVGYDDKGSALGVWAFGLVTCDWCSSIWLGFGAMLAWKYGGTPSNLVAVALSYSAVAGIVRERVA